VQPYVARILLGVWLGTACALHAQIDPDKRQLFELGYNQSMEGRGPIAGYAYYYLNQPGFLRTNLTLRLAVAPIYLDSELGVSRMLGPNTDVGFGLAGGGYADSYSEIRQGHYYKEESFVGHGAEVSVNLYHRFNPDQKIPLHGIVRIAGHFSTYEVESRTAAGFVIPADRLELRPRVGLRWGGREPSLSPELAMEVSAWYEGQFRGDHGPYGFAGDRSVQADSHLFWGRALMIYTLPESQHSFSASLTVGTSVGSDRFSGYKLGSVLPLATEFPLSLPGYYFDEIAASRFALLGLSYTLPLDAEKRWGLMAYANTAVLDYVSGLQQPGDWHTGVGGGISYKSPNKVWHVMLGYGYGVDAIRSHGRGASSVGLLIQYDLGAQRNRRAEREAPELGPEKSRGLFRFFGL
jgi:hypothetical protein